MNIEELTKLKKLLDDGVISQAEFNLQKKKILRENKKSNNIGLIIGIVAVVIICTGIIGSVGSGEKETDVPSKQNSIVDDGSSIMQKTDKTVDKYSSILPIELSASIYDDIIGMPTLKCNIKNISDKDIAAIKIYFDPTNVYGEKISTIFTNNNLYTDTLIPAGETISQNWRLLDTDTNGGSLYVYSVYFSDGSEWGDRNAPDSEIKKYAYKLSVKY